MNKRVPPCVLNVMVCVVSIGLLALVLHAGIAHFSRTVKWKAVEELVLEKIEQATGKEIALEGVWWDPAGEVGMRGLRVTDPEHAQTPPLLSLGEIVLHYDLSSILDGTVGVELLELRQPHFHLWGSARQRAPSRGAWLPLMAALPVRVEMKECRVSGAVVAVKRDGAAAIEAVLPDLLLRGVIGRGKLVGHIVIREEGLDGPNLVVGVAADVPRNLAARIGAEVRVSQHRNATLAVRGNVNLRDVTLQADRHIRPPDMAAEFHLEVHGGGEALHISSLDLGFGATSAIRVRGGARRLGREPELDLEVYETFLSLEEVSRYLAGAVPSLELAGELEIPSWKIQGSLAQRRAEAPLTMSGTLAFRGVEAALPDAGVALEGGEGRLEVERFTLERWRPRHAVGAGDVQIRHAHLRELSLKGIRGVWQGIPADTSLEEAIITGTIDVDGLEMPIGRLGRAKTAARARLELVGDLGRGNLDRLEGEWQVGEVVRGDLSGSVARFGEDGVDLHGSFEADLAGLTTLFAAADLAELPVHARGKATGRLDVQGKLSTNLAAEPVHISLGVALDEVSLEGEGVRLDGVSGSLDVASGFFSPFILAKPSMQGRVTAGELGAGPAISRQLVLEVEGAADGLIGKARSAPFACLLRFSGEDWSVSGETFSAGAVRGDLAAEGNASTGMVEDLEVEVNLEARELSVSQRLAAEGATFNLELDSGGPLSRAGLRDFSSRGTWTVAGLRGTGVDAGTGSATGTVSLTASADEEGALSELLLAAEANVREVPLRPGVSLDEIHLEAETTVRGHLLLGEPCNVTGMVAFSGSGAQTDGGELAVSPLTGSIRLGGAYRMGGFLEDPAVEAVVNVAGLAVGDMLALGPSELKLSATAEGNPLERAQLHVHLEAQGEGLQSARIGATVGAVQSDYNAEAVLVGGKEIHQPSIRGLTTLEALAVGKILAQGPTQIRSETDASGPLRQGEKGTLRSAVHISVAGLSHRELPIAVGDVQGMAELPLDLGGDRSVEVREMHGSVRAGEIAVGEQVGLHDAHLQFELENQGRFFEIAGLSAALKAGSVVLAQGDIHVEDEDVEAAFKGAIDLAAREVVAHEVRLTAPHWFTLKAGGQGNLANRDVAVEAEVTELDVARILAILPAGSGTWRPTFTLPLKPSLTINVSGHLPRSADERPIPIAADLRCRIEDAGLSWPERTVRVDGLAAHCHLTYSQETLRAEGSLSGGVVAGAGVLGEAVREVAFAYDVALDPRGRLKLEQGKLTLPEQGLTVLATGAVDRGRRWSRKDLAGGVAHILEVAGADVSVDAALRADEGKEIAPGLWVRGVAAVSARGRWRPGEQAAINGDVRLDGVAVHRGKALAIEGINGHLPFAKTLAVSAVPEAEGALPEEARGEAVRAEEGVLSFSELLRPYSPLQNVLRIDTVRFGDLTIDEVVADLLYRDNALVIPRFQARVLDGVVAGRAFVGGREESQAVEVAFEFAGLNVKKLPGVFADIPDEAGEIRGNVALTLGLMPSPGERGIDVRSIDGEINITRIGEGVVDRLLLFLDPEESNPSIVDSRRRLKYAVPTKISASIRHGSLSLNLQLKARALGGKTIEVPTIRRIPLYRLVRFARVQEILGQLEPVRVGLAALAASAIVVDEQGQWVFR